MYTHTSWTTVGETTYCKNSVKLNHNIEFYRRRNLYSIWIVHTRTLYLLSEGKWNQLIQSAALGCWEGNEEYSVLKFALSKDCCGFLSSSASVHVLGIGAVKRMAACFRNWRHACRVYNVRLSGWRHTHLRRNRWSVVEDRSREHITGNTNLLSI